MFIKLKECDDGETVFVSIDNIGLFSAMDTDKTMVALKMPLGEHKLFAVYVKETPEEIMQLIEGEPKNEEEMLIDKEKV